MNDEILKLTKTIENVTNGKCLQIYLVNPPATEADPTLTIGEIRKSKKESKIISYLTLLAVSISALISIISIVK